MSVEPTIRHDPSALFELIDGPPDEGLEHYLARSLQVCVEWFGAGGATLFLRVDQTREYELAARAGLEATAPLGARIRMGQGIAGTAIETGEPMLLEDPLEHAALGGKIQARRAEIGSSLVVPLQTPQLGRLGVLCLTRSRSEKPFHKRDLEAARKVVGQVALAVANARLFARAKDAEAESRGLHEKLGAVIASVAVGLMVVDHQGWVEEVNPEATLLFGRSPSALEAWPEYANAASPSLRSALNTVIVKALEGQRADARAMDPATSRAWSVVAAPMPQGGAVVAIQDVSEAERAQHELEEARRLAEIGQMTAAIAHEIRNPLTGIRGAAQMVRSLRGEASMFGEIIEEETKKLDRLCGEFLEFAKPFVLEFKEGRLSDLAECVVELSRGEFLEANVGLTLESNPNEPMIMLDSMRIEQVMRNLLQNALQASKAGQNVTLRIENGAFQVVDEGSGMDEEQLSSLFTPFFTTKPKGTGLGMCVVKKIVDAHGGEIEVRSRVGQGTTVRIGLTQGMKQE